MSQGLSQSYPYTYSRLASLTLHAMSILPVHAFWMHPQYLPLCNILGSFVFLLFPNYKDFCYNPEFQILVDFVLLINNDVFINIL